MNDKIDVLDKGFVRLVRYMGDDKAIVDNARNSYGDGTKMISTDRALLRALMRDRHTSPFECCMFTFHVRAPIFIFRQWHRHRTWSYNELSGRYSVLPDDCYVPKEEHVTTQDPLNKQGGTSDLVPLTNGEGDSLETIFPNWAACFEHEQNELKNFYKMYIKAGMRRELARINLPLSQYSEMHATVNLHNLLHFLKLRLDKHAQYEIRVYAQAILDLIRPIFPVTVEAFEDYVLNSMTLSKQEIELLRSFLDMHTDDSPKYQRIQKNIEEVLPSKREREQFYDKLRWLDTIENGHVFD